MKLNPENIRILAGSFFSTYLTGTLLSLITDNAAQWNVKKENTKENINNLYSLLLSTKAIFYGRNGIYLIL